MSRVLQFLLFSFVSVVVSTTLGGCGGGLSQSPVRSSFVEFDEKQKQEIESQSAGEYRIQASDVLKVAFADQKQLNQNGVLVLPDGAISMEGMDRLEVAGMTLTEADFAITEKYSKEYRDPNISVMVLETSGVSVYVMGEVKNPGMYKMAPGGLGLVGAVARAGGFTDDAASEGSVLVRVSPDGYLVQEVDLSGFNDPAYIDLALVKLLPNDIIYVPRSRIGDFAYFSRSVFTGLSQITRIAYDLKFLSSGVVGRY